MENRGVGGIITGKIQIMMNVDNEQGTLHENFKILMEYWKCKKKDNEKNMEVETNIYMIKVLSHILCGRRWSITE